MIEIRVVDSGIGISPQSLASIFTMFSQLSHDDSADGAAAAGQDGGLGIGLALARAVVTLHGGTIEAFSEGPGHGAQFVLRLPMSEDAQAGQNVEAAGDEPRHARVLVVDDNRDSAESLAALLRLDEHEVLVAYGGRDALQIAERAPLDLILLDIGMPDMDGYEVARLLRASEQSASVRIVALSGYGQAGDREKSLAAGCDGHLVKPVAPGDLAAWLRPAPVREA
jgi:CheY-like chemotaxis protein